MKLALAAALALAATAPARATDYRGLGAYNTPTPVVKRSITIPAGLLELGNDAKICGPFTLRDQGGNAVFALAAGRCFPGR